jgi:hypothetical protein
LSTDRSKPRIVQSALDFKSWQQRLPTVDEARPERCPSCGRASCPVGAPLTLHGHGTRERELRGPAAPGQPPASVPILVRRYRCKLCHAVIVVVPCEMLAQRRYSAAAIAFALALWGLALATAAEVRRQVSPDQFVGATAAGGWASLRRWARAVQRGRLFPRVPLPSERPTGRQVAASAASAIAGRAGPESRARPLEQRAFEAAARSAGWA